MDECNTEGIKSLNQQVTNSFRPCCFLAVVSATASSGMAEFEVDQLIGQKQHPQTVWDRLLLFWIQDGCLALPPSYGNNPLALHALSVPSARPRTGAARLTESRWKVSHLRSRRAPVGFVSAGRRRAGRRRRLQVGSRLHRAIKSVGGC